MLHILQFNSSSRWAAWIKSTILKGQTIWQIPIPSDCSWIWKQILKLRPLALQYIHYKVGRGDQISLWFDPWINGAVINPNNDLLSNSGLHAKATVNDILLNSSWSLPQSNHHEVITFRTLIEANPPPANSTDCILWNSLNIDSVTARHVWECIRQRLPQVTWHNITWNKLHVPRYSFMLWLGFLKKIQTNDVTMHYSGRVHSCPLCSLHAETFNHLFFECDYSRVILGASFRLGDWTNIPMHWDGIIAYLLSFQGTKLTKDIMSLSLAVSFYKVWEARNLKLHTDTIIPPNFLAKDVINIIKSRLSKYNSFLKITNYCHYYCNWLL